MNYNYETDLTIIGCGPAGLTAAIYACRANLNVIILDKNSPGGKLITTASIENYPGFNNVTGPDLSLKFFEQSQNLGAKFLFNEVLDIKADHNSNFKIITLKDNKFIKTKAVIVATGMVNRKINCPNEDRLYQKGISYCAICDGALYKNKPVVVIGSGRSAVEEAIFLSDIASHVTVIANKSEFKADQINVDHLKSLKNVSIFMDTETVSFNGDNKLVSVTLMNKKTQEKFDLACDGAFIFIGFLPMAPTVDGKSMLSATSNFIDVNNEMETAWPGIFSAGDIVTKKIRQISTAINDGTIAALSAVDYIKNQAWN